jgi:hypothetical protein
MVWGKVFCYQDAFSAGAEDPLRLGGEQDGGEGDGKDVGDRFGKKYRGGFVFGKEVREQVDQRK